MGVVMTSTQAAGAEGEKLEGSLVSAEPKEFTIFLNFNNMPSDVFFNDPSAEKRTKTGHSHAE